MSVIGILNTSIGSANLGDHIIMDAALSHLKGLLPKSLFIHFTSHDPLCYHSLKLQKRVVVNFLCGTNCLNSHMLLRPAWAVNPLIGFFMKPVIPIGVGWGAYQGRADTYTKLLLRQLFSRDVPLSVRDSYTKAKLEECGFKEVINTACPTMWNLTPQHCARVPTVKTNQVIFTLTDYARDYNADLAILEILARSYEQTHIWIQGYTDLNYLHELRERNPFFFEKNTISLIPPSLSAYDDFLERNDVDYVGTRLHGGIRALQKGRRSIIIAVDNRAEEKRKDFSLPVVRREDLDTLEPLINSNWETNLNIPWDAITRFKNSIQDHFNFHDEVFDFLTDHT